MLWVPHTTTAQQQSRYVSPEGTGVEIGSLIRGGGNLTDGRPTPLLQTEGGGVALCCDIHGKWDGYWGPLMEGCRIS